MNRLSGHVMSVRVFRLVLFSSAILERTETITLYLCVLVCVQVSHTRMQAAFARRLNTTSTEARADRKLGAKGEKFAKLQIDFPRRTRKLGH